MKKFFAICPLQRGGGLQRSVYETTGNERLAYKETSFPAIPLMNGYAEPGEEIRVYVLRYRHEWAEANCGKFAEAEEEGGESPEGAVLVLIVANLEDYLSHKRSVLPWSEQRGRFFPLFFTESVTRAVKACEYLCQCSVLERHERKQEA